MNKSGLFLGKTWHQRLIPVEHSFVYPVIFIRIPLRPNQKFWGFPGLFWVQMSDFISHKKQSIYQSLEDLLQKNNIESPLRKATLLTLPRFLCFGFRPASFWHLELENNQIVQLCEINNTYGEKHTCILKGEQNTAERIEKQFFVSPFNPVNGSFEFEFSENWHNDNQLKILVNTLTPQNHYLIKTGIQLTQCSSWVEGLAKVFTKHSIDLMLTTTRIIKEAAILLKRHQLFHYDHPKAHPSTIAWGKAIFLQRLLLQPLIQKIIHK